MTLRDRPELTMVRRAIVPGVVALMVAAVAGWVLGGPEAAASAAIGIVVVLANFAAAGLSLAWASTVSVGAVMAVALGGFVVRLGVIVAVLFALDTLSWFSPLAFGLAVIPATLLLLGYEAQLVSKGLGGTLQIPADPAAARAGAAYAAREAR
ncbi:MAG TPA: ATP synthase subunit I [Actinomycetota bacterium]